MNRTQPIDAIYGGVINGIIKTISSQLCFANCVRASKNAVGTAMTVEHSTTHTPSSSELQMVCTFSRLAIVCHARYRSRRPSVMTALANTVIRGGRE